MRENNQDKVGEALRVAAQAAEQSAPYDPRSAQALEALKEQAAENAATKRVTVRT